MAAALPADVARTCATYLALADRHAPGLVEGLYLQGSVALGDYRPGLVREALRIRVGGHPAYRNPWRRRADLIGFMTQALVD